MTITRFDHMETRDIKVTADSTQIICHHSETCEIDKTESSEPWELYEHVEFEANCFKNTLVQQCHVHRLPPRLA